MHIDDVKKGDLIVFSRVPYQYPNALAVVKKVSKGRVYIEKPDKYENAHIKYPAYITCPTIKRATLVRAATKVEIERVAGTIVSYASYGNVDTVRAYLLSHNRINQAKEDRLNIGDVVVDITTLDVGVIKSKWSGKLTIKKLDSLGGVDEFHNSSFFTVPSEHLGYIEKLTDSMMNKIARRVRFKVSWDKFKSNSEGFVGYHFNKYSVERAGVGGIIRIHGDSMYRILAIEGDDLTLLDIVNGVIVNTNLNSYVGNVKRSVTPIFYIYTVGKSCAELSNATYVLYATFNRCGILPLLRMRKIKALELLAYAKTYVKKLGEY